jgi:hypothetical protein
LDYLPRPLVNNIFGFIFDGNFLQVGGSFWEKKENNEISKKIFKGGHSFENNNNM